MNNGCKYDKARPGSLISLSLREYYGEKGQKTFRLISIRYIVVMTELRFFFSPRIEALLLRIYRDSTYSNATCAGKRFGI